MSRHIYMVMLAALLCCVQAFAQMSFSFYGGATATFSALSDGTQMVVLPAGTDLQGCITGVEVDGVAVNAADVVPNPTTTPITEGEIETFVYQDKAYSFRFYSGAYFTVVMFSDAHTAPGSNYANDELARFVTDITKMGKSGGKRFSFSKAPKEYVPTTDLVLFLGDMEADRPSDKWSNFYNSTIGFKNAGIPFVAIAGNHELCPDYYDDNSEGRTKQGSEFDEAALNKINQIIADAKGNNAEINSSLQRFKDSSHSGNRYIQTEPFTFTFHGVRFYMGQTYWFQKIYQAPLTALGSSSYYAPDNIISQLSTFVDSHTTEPSIWTQHYPFVWGSDCNRWWLDQNNSGKYKNVSTSYPLSNTQNDAAAANARKDVLVNIINKTKNPVHFSGHVHSSATNRYGGLVDYSIGNGKGLAYIVLCKEGIGFVECKEVYFSY